MEEARWYDMKCCVYNINEHEDTSASKSVSTNVDIF